MVFEKIEINKVEIEQSCFEENGAREFHLMLKPQKLNKFNIQLQQILDAFGSYTGKQELTKNSIAFFRLFVSDYANQLDIEETIKSHKCNNEVNFSLSVVQQPPLSNNKVEAWIHIIDDKHTPNNITKQNNELSVSRNNYTHLWSTQLITGNGATDSDKQTENIFRAYNNSLEKKGLSLRDNCIRTWLFVKDVDFNYKGVVKARKEFFEAVDMTSQTNYITSTGIEGRYHKPNINVIMDAYSVGGIKKEQVKFLTAPEKLNPTIDYGVTFERGTSVDYGDRRHIFISGTASINNKGEVVHLCDVEKQVVRAIENIEALLADAQADLDDIAHLIVYIRDIADYPVINNFFKKQHSKIPKVIVLAPVCRPEWLIELECIAIKKIENKAYANF